MAGGYGAAGTAGRWHDVCSSTAHELPPPPGSESGRRRRAGAGGGAFDPGARRGLIHASVAPRTSETVIEKGLPNSFADTGLAEALEAIGPRPLVVAGFMTHMCVSATVRAALDRGLSSTVAMDATATRDLPDPTDGTGGGVLPADTVHRAALAAIADRFATVVPAAEIPD